MEEFAKGGRVRVVRTKSPYDTEGKLLRAQSRMNEAQYSPVSNNCEHFARWCTTGTSESRQVRRTITALAGVTVAAVTVMAALQMVKAVVKPAARA
jgi:hypothetical protein